MPELIYTLRCEPEDTPVEGNAMASGDPVIDQDAEQWIRDELDRGNEWAWCTAHVIVELIDDDGLVLATGHAYLGCCSYHNAAEFTQPSGYFEDMKHQALHDLKTNVALTHSQSSRATKCLKKLKA